MSMRVEMMRVEMMLAAILLGGCGARGPAPPPTMQQRAAAFEATVDSADAEAVARAGWWSYLAGDPVGAEGRFAKSDVPLARLGQARLALDRLHPRQALEAARAAARAPGTLGAIADRWARLAGASFQGGQALGRALPGRTVIKSTRHTSRISFLPYLDLRRLQSRVPTLQGDTVLALGEWWALTSKAPKPDPDGIVLSEFPLEDGAAHLELEARGPFIAWRDGRVVAATDPGRFPPLRARFEATGTGPLLVGWAARRHPKLTQLEAPVRTTRRRPDDLVDRYLEASLARLDGDSATARAVLEGAPSSPAFDVLRALVAADDPAVGRRSARDQARQAWEAALQLAPARAHLGLAGALSSDESAAAIEHLQKAIALAPNAYAPRRRLLEVALSAGRESLATEALSAAMSRAPKPCQLVDAQRALASARPGYAHAVTEALFNCGRPAEAAERLLEAGRAQTALTRLDAQPRQTDTIRRLRARALIALGRLAEARTALIGAKDIASQLLAADLQIAAGEGTIPGALQPVVTAHPTSHEALELMAAYPELSPFHAVALGTAPAMAAYNGRLEGPAVRVLDHAAQIYYGDGKSLRRTHELIKIESREAAEAFGEIEPPSDARVLVLRTIKADGRTLDAEASPDKDAISLTDLKVGDFVEVAWLQPGDNGYLYNSGFLTPRVLLRGADLPIAHQRFEVYWGERQLDHQRLLGVPAPARTQLGALGGLRFDVHDQPIARAEPSAPPAPLWLPSARVGSGVELSAELAYLRDRTLKGRRHGAAFEAWATAALGPRQRPLRAQIEALARATRKAVEDEGGLIDGEVVRALEAGRGSRALTLSAALEAAGIRHRLLATRPKVHASAGPFLQAADFPYPLIETAAGWIDPNQDRAPLGFVPFPLRGGDALVVWPPEAANRPVPIPEHHPVADRREIVVTLDWNEAGTLSGHVVDTMAGQEAINIARYLAQLDPDQRPRLAERLLVNAVGDAQVSQFVDPLAEAEGPIDVLRLAYHFEVKAPDGIEFGLFPMSPGRSWAGLSERQTALFISTPIDQTVRVHIESDRDLKVLSEPKDTGESSFHHTTTLRADDDTVDIFSRLVVPAGLVSPKAYPAFARWARPVDAAERVAIERR